MEMEIIENYEYSFEEEDNPGAATATTHFTTSTSTTTTELTDIQQMVLAILPIPAAMLSILGSSTIIYMTCFAHQRQRKSSSSRRRRHQQQRWTPYTRLLLGMSLCDILSSIQNAVTTFLRPQETSSRLWAFGNDTTCSVMGTWNQLASANLFYNAMLSVYFLCTARFGYKNKFISTYIEPMMHLISVGYPLVTATTGAILGVYSETELGLGCWVNDYPRNCGDGPGKTGVECQSGMIGWIFWGLPFILVFLCILINNVIICCFVRRQTWPQRKRKQRKDEEEEHQRQHTGGTTTTTTGLIQRLRQHYYLSTSTFKKPTNYHHKANGVLSETFETCAPSTSLRLVAQMDDPAVVTQHQQFVGLRIANRGENEEKDEVERSSSGYFSGEVDRSIIFGSYCGKSDNDDDEEQQAESSSELVGLEGGHDDDGTPQDCLKLSPSRRPNNDDEEELNKEVNEEEEANHIHKLRKDQIRRLKLVSTQALFFVGSYIICNGWSGLLGLFESTTDSIEDEATLSVRVYPILVLQAFFLPLQGLFNMFVYIRPKYMKCRSEFPDESKLWAFRRAMQGDDVTPTKEQQHQHPQHPPPPPPPPPLINEEQQQQQQVIVSSSGPNNNYNQCHLKIHDAPVDTGLLPRICDNGSSFKVYPDPAGYSRLPKHKDMVSSLTASQQEFDLAKEEDDLEKGSKNNNNHACAVNDTRWWNSTPSKDKRWNNKTKEDLSAWVPMKQTQRVETNAEGVSSITASEAGEDDYVIPVAPVEEIHKQDRKSKKKNCHSVSIHGGYCVFDHKITVKNKNRLSSSVPSKDHGSKKTRPHPPMTTKTPPTTTPPTTRKMPKQDMSAWVPMKRSRRFKSSSGRSRSSVGSSLEVISELSELSFVEPTASSSDEEDYVNDPAGIQYQQTMDPSGRSRWSGDSCGLSSSQVKNGNARQSFLSIPQRTESIIDIVSGILDDGHEESDEQQQGLDHSEHSRWSDGMGRSPSSSPKSPKPSSVTMPKRVQSLVDLASCVVDDGNKQMFDRMVAATAPPSDNASDTPMRVPKRRLSPTPAR